MAWTADTFPTRIRAVSGLGFKGEPLVLHGYLIEGVTHEEGDVVVASAGSLTTAASDPSATILGVLPALTETSPLATGTTRTRTTSATVPDRTKYDDDKSIPFYVWIAGNIFMGHLTTNATTDERADSNLDIYIAVNVVLTSSRFNFGIGGNAAATSTGFVNPQATTVDSSGGLLLRPGPIVDDIGGATGTFNPLITALPTAGPFF